MKKIFSTFVALLAAANMMAQGWPSGYDGVMLQSFYWGSYTESSWSNLTQQADTLSKYFNLIWAPPSGYPNTTSNNMGYYPIYWFNQTSAFGSESDLRTMIKTFKDKETGIIADVVINHKNGPKTWCSFANESVTGQNTGKTYSVTWDNTNYTQICSNDEGNTNKFSEAYGKIKGSKDTGLNEGGCRDLDHTNATTQKNVETYEDFLLNEMGYAGFRYDFVKGYAPTYIKMYNTAANPTYSVGEYWQGTVTDTKTGDHPFGGVKDWVDATGKTSAAFDFPMKYFIQDAFGSNNWSKLTDYANGKTTLMGTDGYAQYAVTFVDNHDTGEPHDNPSPLRANIAAANAYILAMPGTPCIWISHWTAYKTIIKKCILARKLAGVTNTSTVEQSVGSSAGYYAKVKGTKGEVLIVIGSPSVSTTGFQLACEGENFKYYVSNGLDISGIKSIKDEVSSWKAPSFCKVNDGEICAFFEVPSSWSGYAAIKCWAWDANGNYTGGSWPGATCTKVGTTDAGNAVYKWTWDGLFTGTTASTPSHIIFSGWRSSTTFTDTYKIAQQNNQTFKNGNYYGLSTVLGNVIDATTGISKITTTTNTADAPLYNLAGQRVDNNYKGVVIQNGKKVMRK
ncbi:alpha-amylase family glycosyl hydrolase [Hallella absiana]|uniref:alpha-amylase family glycosyl hydrolase n=1 Tax=Hallella absiana TaxID=2925336 RepID=UPI0021C68562|nr:alpha-amylase family glycosyl hydrolase [Hallella absiana]